MSSPDEATDDELRAQVSALEREALPLRRQLDGLRAQVDVLRTELRRRERAAELERRQSVRQELREGETPTLEGLLAGVYGPGDPEAALDAFTFLRESATEVRLGYASASTQAITFTDGETTQEAATLEQAHRLWAAGWEPGTPAARGVRIYPVGSRAERLVPAADIRVALKS